MVRRTKQRGGEDREGLTRPGTSHKAALALYGCHDSMLAAILTSLDVWVCGEGFWPPYTSSFTIELFCERVSRPANKQPRHFVRLRYNDHSLELQGCRETRHHLPNRKDFCTLVCSSPKSKLAYPDLDAFRLDSKRL